MGKREKELSRTQQRDELVEQVRGVLGGKALSRRQIIEKLGLEDGHEVSGAISHMEAGSDGNWKGDVKIAVDHNAPVEEGGLVGKDTYKYYLGEDEGELIERGSISPKGRLVYPARRLANVADDFGLSTKRKGGRKKSK